MPVATQPEIDEVTYLRHLIVGTAVRRHGTGQVLGRAMDEALRIAESWISAGTRVPEHLRGDFHAALDQIEREGGVKELDAAADHIVAHQMRPLTDQELRRIWREQFNSRKAIDRHVERLYDQGVIR